MNSNTPSSHKEAHDPLEHFIAQHREAFDQERAPSRVWDRLEAEINQPSPQMAERKESLLVQLYPYWRKLAVACMLLTIGMLSGLLLSEKLGSGDGNLTSTNSRANQLENRYQEELADRLAQVEAFRPDSALRAELVSMTRPDYKLAVDLQKLGRSNEQIILETMALEYQAKLDALEHVLARLQAADRSRAPLNQSPQDVVPQRL